jgi:hypothetical protein
MSKTFIGVGDFNYYQILMHACAAEYGIPALPRCINEVVQTFAVSCIIKTKNDTTIPLNLPRDGKWTHSMRCYRTCVDSDAEVCKQCGNYYKVHYITNTPPIDISTCWHCLQRRGINQIALPETSKMTECGGKIVYTNDSEHNVYMCEKCHIKAYECSACFCPDANLTHCDTCNKNKCIVCMFNSNIVWKSKEDLPAFRKYISDVGESTRINDFNCCRACLYSKFIANKTNNLL